MSDTEGASPAAGAAAGSAAAGSAAAGSAAAAAGADGGGRVLHARSFKLRFAAQQEPGRSDVSSVKPLGLPATVTDKFYRRSEPDGVEAERTQRALARLRGLFARGPRDKLRAPATAAHEYGWWWKEASKISSASFSDRRLNHHIQDSAWLKARLLVLAADDKLKQK